MKKQSISYSFLDLFNLDEIQRLQDAFSAATGVASIITYPDGSPITKPSGFSCLCQDVIRNTPQGLMNCMRSDAVIGSPKKEGPRIQKCLSAGLIDGGASIMFGDIHIASWMIGQVMDQEADLHKLMIYADHISADKEAFSDALQSITKMSREQFGRIADYLFFNAQMLSQLAVTNAQQKAELQLQRKVEQDLAIDKELFQVTIQSMGDGVITTDVYGNITSMNKIAEHLTGWTHEEAMGAHLEDVFQLYYAKTRARVHNPMKKILTSNSLVIKSNDFFLISCDKDEYYISGSGTSIRDDNQSLLGTVIIFRDITEEIYLNEQIRHLSQYDMLTGLHNRSFFEKIIQQLQEADATRVSIILGDVNGLKISNDVFGHSEGDRLLIQIGKILRKSCRMEDVVSRWGGDEFAIILQDTSTEEAMNICEKIIKNCEEDHECMIPLNIALGVATKDDASQDLNTIIRIAENRMYRNKILEKQHRNSMVLSALKVLLFAKHGESESHASQVADLARELGHSMGFTNHELSDLYIAAQLHDIGKVALPDSILNKPGKLNFDEYLEIHRHSEIGFRIAQSIGEVAHIAEFILYHHENWDGTGYPQGRSGDSIPLISRIIRICDAYVAMTNPSIYQRTRTHEDAMIEINKCAGTQFDPDLVDHFTQILLAEYSS